MKESLTKEIKRVLKTIPDPEAKIIEFYFGIHMDPSPDTRRNRG